MTAQEQNNYREELIGQLMTHDNKPLRLWRFDSDSGAHELIFLDVKFEDDEIVVELGDK